MLFNKRMSSTDSTAPFLAAFEILFKRTFKLLTKQGNKLKKKNYQKMYFFLINCPTNVATMSETYRGGQFVPLNYSMHAKMVQAYQIPDVTDHKDMDIFSAWEWIPFQK